jgi:hypothetical protein
MTRNKIFVVHKSNGYKAFLSKIIVEYSIDSWVFFGEDALIPYQLEISILKDIERFSIAEQLGKLQYENMEQYIDFIDDLESRSGEELWWASRLSWKNPWDSSFYLAYCQLDFYRKILLNDTFKNKNLLVLIEDFALYQCVKLNSNIYIDRIFSYYTAENYFINFSEILKSYLRRPYIFLSVAVSKIVSRFIFKNSIFDIENFNQQELIILPTFIDSRNFRSGTYIDPFLGKIFEIESIKKRTVVIIPIEVVATKKQLKLFNSWLQSKEFKVFFLYNSLSLIDILIKSFGSVTRSFSNQKMPMLNELDITPLINKEKRKERRSFSLLNKFLSAFSKKIGLQQNKKLTIYPFENQAWERVFLYEMGKYNNFTSIGLQNAPCPKLSTRFFFSKKFIEDLPFPDFVIATGNVSFQNLSQNFCSNTEIIQSQSGRNFISGLPEKKRNQLTNIMVACSLGEKESVELIIFTAKALKDNKNLEVCIVPHPLAQYDYIQLLKKIKCPAQIYITKAGFNEELAKADIVLFDSSSAGLEAMSNGIQPIFIGHECSLHVNPNEFDKHITKRVYSEIALLKAIIEIDFDPVKARAKVKEYFGDENTPLLQEVIETKICSTFDNI